MSQGTTEGATRGPAQGTAQGSELSGHLALLAVQGLFGIFPVFGRMAMDPELGFAPFAVASARIAFGALVFAVLAFARLGRRALPPRVLVPRILGLGLLGIVANQGLFLLGLARSSATDAGVLVCLIPVFTYAVAVLSGQERVHGRRVLGVALALGGTLPLLFARGATLAADHALGNTMIAANCLCYAIYLVASRPLVREFPPLAVAAWVYVASLPALPVFFLAGPLEAGDPSSTVVWASLAFVLIGPTVLTYLLNLFALTRVQASTTAFYIYLQPLIAAAGGALWLGETLHGALIPAAAGLLLGGLLVLRRP